MTWPRSSVAAAARAFSSAPRRVPLCSLQTLRDLKGGAFKFPLEDKAATSSGERKGPRRRALATGFVFLSADTHEPRGFVNRCPHARLELDLDDGDFFCDGFLQCKAHGAFFDPATGICLHGPAAKREGAKKKQLQGLEPLRVEVDGDQVVLVADSDEDSGRQELPAGVDLDQYRREKQRDLAAARAQHADEIQEIQRLLAEKTRARLEEFSRRDQQLK